MRARGRLRDMWIRISRIRGGRRIRRLLFMGMLGVVLWFCGFLDALRLVVCLFYFVESHVKVLFQLHAHARPVSSRSRPLRHSPRQSHRPILSPPPDRLLHPPHSNLHLRDRWLCLPPAIISTTSGRPLQNNKLHHSIFLHRFSKCFGFI